MLTIYTSTLASPLQSFGSVPWKECGKPSEYVDNFGQVVWKNQENLGVKLTKEEIHVVDTTSFIW